MGSISSPQQFIFSSRYWHLTNLWNMDVFPGVWCVKMFLCQVSEGVNKLIKFSTHNAQWELTLTLYFDSWEIPYVARYLNRSSIGDCVDKNSINLIVSWHWTLDTTQQFIQRKCQQFLVIRTDQYHWYYQPMKFIWISPA